MNKNKLLWASLAVFFISRLVILGYPQFLSDVLGYHEWALESLKEGHTAYRDYFYPYPPLALPFTTWPIFFTEDFATFLHLFHFSFFMIECALVWSVVQVSRRVLQFTDQRIAMLIVFYSGLGLFVGQVLYDRLDLLVAWSVFACALAFMAPRKTWTYLLWNVIFLFKLLSAFWAPYTTLLSGIKNRVESGPRTAWRSCFTAALAFAPAAVVMAFFWWRSDGAIFRSLGDHAERTIQVESTWASMVFLTNAINPQYRLTLMNGWGGQHVAPESIPWILDIVSRYLGLALLPLSFLWLAFQRRSQIAAFDPARLARLHLYILFTVLLGLMVTQRVLSPQYFLWVMAPLALVAVDLRSRGFALACGLLYFLVYLGFGRYMQLLTGDLTTVLIIAGRNVLLTLVWLRVVWEVRASLSRTAV